MITAKTVKVTPEQAKEWLDKAAPNRQLYKQVIERYAKDMVNGRWQVNGEPIIISSKDRMLDGQHRCMACIAAGIGFNTLVVYGVDENCFKTLGNGQIRSNSDVLFMMGEKNTHKLAGTLRWLWLLEQESPLYNNKKTTHQDAIAMLGKYPEARQSLELCSDAYRVAPITALATVHIMGARVYDKVIADAFVEAVITGANLGLGNPARVLRERLLLDRQANRGQPKLNQHTVMAFIIKAFNLFAQKETCSYLKWVPNEPFPKISKAPTIVANMRRHKRERMDESTLN